MQIALLGIPNCGKTTVFNRLTGAHFPTGNYAGVTVTVETMPLAARKELYLADLPGVYGLYPEEAAIETADAALCRRTLQETPPDGILFLLDGKQIRASLALLWEYRMAYRSSVPVCLVCSMGFPDGFSIHALAEAVGYPCVWAKDLPGLWREIDTIAHAAAAMPRKDFSSAQPPVEEGIQWVEQVLSAIQWESRTAASPLCLADRFLLCSPFSIVWLLLLGVLVFWFVFGVGGPLASRWVTAGMEIVTKGISHCLVRCSVPLPLLECICDGMLGAAGSVVGFLPYLLLVSLALNALEESGIGTRAAMLSDQFMRRVGLSGRCILPVFLGMGCTVPALLGSRIIRGEKRRRTAAAFLPFVPCSGKIPLLALLSSAFFPAHRFRVMAYMYTLSLSVGILTVWIQSGGKTEVPPEPVWEIPPYRLPHWTIGELLHVLSLFWRRITLLLLPASMLLWCLSHWRLSGGYSSDPSVSILYRLAEKAAPLFQPLGWTSPVVIAAGFAGMIAKEEILSGLSVGLGCLGEELVFRLGVLFTPAAALSYLVFCYLSPPCLSACAAYSAEQSRIRSVWMIVWHSLLAYGAAWSTYRLAICLGIG